MSKKIYVGNLPHEATESDLAALFEQMGEVTAANIVMDRETGRSRGFGFVEMSDSDADTAIEEMDGMELDGRKLTVNEARPRPDRPSGQRRGPGGGGRPGGRGGYSGQRRY